MARLARRQMVVFVGLAVLLVLAIACAKSEEKAGTTAPAAPSAEKAAPQPAAAPAPKAPAAQPAPTAAVGPQPLVPGGPPYDKTNVEKEWGYQYFQKWHWKKLPLWTKAKYGGEAVGANTLWSLSVMADTLNVLNLSRPSQHGMLLYIDMGLCSMVGREDFSKCDGKYGHSDGMVIVPGIFQRWEQPDPTTWVFRIRSGVVWPAIPPMSRADRTVTAEDIAWFLSLVKEKGALRDNFRVVKSFEAVDRSTMKVNLLEPYADMLLALAHTSLGIFPKECYEEKDCIQLKIVSPGPFLIKEHLPREKIVLERNPEFYLKGLPYLDRRVGIAITDPNAARAAFYTRKTHYGSASSPVELDAVLKQMPDGRVHAQTILSGSHALRPDLKGPFADVRVRRALAMTLDHSTMWQASHGGYTWFPTLLSRHYFGEDFYLSLEQAGEWYQYNPEKAKKLMAEAGYPNGFSTGIQTSFGAGNIYELQLVAQAQWKKHLNVDVKIKVVDNTAHQASFYDAKWEGLWFWWCWNVSCWADADASLVHFLVGSRQNPQGINDPVIEDLYRRQRGEMDPAKRAALLWQFEQRELDQVYYIRQALGININVTQPWEMNGVSHQVAYYGIINGPAWLGMIDTDMQKVRQK